MITFQAFSNTKHKVRLHFGEMTMTSNDVSCPLHLSIKGCVLDHDGHVFIPGIV